MSLYQIGMTRGLIVQIVFWLYNSGFKYFHKNIPVIIVHSKRIVKIYQENFKTQDTNSFGFFFGKKYYYPFGKKTGLINKLCV